MKPLNERKIRGNSDATRLLFIMEGLLVGLLAGGAVSLFRLFIELSLHFWQYLYRMVPTHLWLIAVFILINGILALIIGMFVRSEPNIMGSGIPQVEGQLAGDIKMNWWQILWRKWITGILGIGSGLFLGREGPSIQLGAAIGQGVAERINSIESSRRVFIACGSAAGLSAAFNAPMAGTLFVLEEVYHNFSPLVWMTSLAGAIGADFISSNFFGLVPVLQLHYQASFPLYLYGHLILLGVVLGVLGFVYQKVLLFMPRAYAAVAPKLPRHFHGIIPMLLVIPIGIFLPQTLGGGNQLILDVRNLPSVVWILFSLFALRFIFSMVSYGSGLPGGIFLPILTLGALIGVVYGTLMAQLGLMPKIYIMNCVIFAMAGYFAGIGKAPFTAIILITEMVGNLEHLMPLAVTSFVAYVIVDVLGGAPIYESLLERLNLGKKLNQLSGKNDRLEFPVFAGSQLEKKLIRDIHWPNDVLLIGIRRGEREVIPHGDTLIHSGDTLILLTDRNERSKVKRMLHEMNTMGT
ncbi:ClC family H(+)/Cl(-) exchange transporter [Sporolactobacillus sp. STSJ-5]|uniref:ClC family H(+)/Cl(-) exchange transporter n=1 Tax=Sporolactobacillus sp. STSJ-5 TaxID=2965076 RepID=UPI00210493D7|nr:ClC family H(+)/Cl(-) exchange transporter [Sporolactobacillus sp. STSJ-5]MCQ2010262.1 ClC family H(+)/Cl(-) exchange transporter [Sporolactobacillus sp. STSJ-5]